MPDIEVIIRKGTSADGVSQTAASSSVGEAQVNGREKGKKSLTQNAVNAALIQVGKQALNQGLQMYADLSGDYYSNEVINSFASLATDAALIYTAGPVGAIAVAGKYALQITKSFADNYRNQQEHNFTVERLGQISTRGSRY